MEERKLNFDTPLLSVRQAMMNRRRKFMPYNPDTNTEQVTDPVAVPFMWEQIPGRAKEEEISVSPSFKEIEKKFQDQPINFYSDLARVRASAVKLDEVKKEANLENKDDDDDDDDDEEDFYSDAVETLSRTDSISCTFNCSMGSLTGSSGWVQNPSGTFLVDQKTRDFMMNRFLPAARAVAVGLSQHTASSGKQQLAIVPFEQPKSDDLVQEGNSSSKVPSKQYSYNIMHHYYQDVSKEETEDDGEDEDEDDTTKYDFESARAKGCGLLPRLCLKSSGCLLNPVPGMKIRAPSPTSFTSKAKNLIKEASVRSVSQPKSRSFVDNEKKLENETPTPKMHGMEKSKLFGGSSRFNFSGEVRNRGGLSPFRQPRNTNEVSFHQQPSARVNFSGELRPRGGFSPRMQSRNIDNVSSFHQQASKRVNFSGELLARSRNSDVSAHQYASNRVNFSGELPNQRHLSPFAQSRNNNNYNNNNLSSQRALSEKTLYVDSSKALQNSSSSSSTLSDQDGSCVKPVDVEVKEEISYSCQDRQCMDDLKEETYSDSIEEPEGGDGENAAVAVVVYGGSLDPLPPSIPLPSLKSPSESWLWKALPSVSSRSSFHSFKKHNPKRSSNDTKWENIVKSSNLHHDHVRYSEELASRVSQQLKP